MTSAIFQHLTDWLRGQEQFVLNCPGCGGLTEVRLGTSFYVNAYMDHGEEFILSEILDRAVAECPECQIVAGWDAYPRDF